MKKTASISALIVAFSAIAGLAVLSTACGDDDTTGGGGTNTSSSGTSGASSSGESSSGASSSGASSSGSSGATGAQAVAQAQCAHLKACTPNQFAANYADEAACATAKSSGTATTYPGLTALDDAALQTCASKIAAQTDCTVVTSPAECTPAQGNLTDGTACNIGLNQCASGACSTPDSSFQCGKCAAAKAKDETCDPAKFECGAGLFCKTNKCAEYIAKDADCALGDLCTPGTTCTPATGGKCKAPGKIGDTCASAADCYAGLFCGADTKCAEYTYGAVGDACDPATGKLCAKSACDSADTKKCVAYVATGATCDGIGKACDPSKDTCDLAGDKTCKATPAPKVCQ